MATISKPRVVKDYDKLTPEIVQQIKLKYPRGFVFYLITYTDHKGRFVSALPFETSDRHYLIRMTVTQAQAIIREDDDYGEDGVLKENIREELKEKLEAEMAEEMGEEEEHSEFRDDPET